MIFCPYKQQGWDCGSIHNVNKKIQLHIMIAICHMDKYFINPPSRTLNIKLIIFKV